jgi:hypothetical protein
LVSGQYRHMTRRTRLARLVAATRRAGAIIASASSLGTAITTIVHWLGPAENLMHLIS